MFMRKARIAVAAAIAVANKSNVDAVLLKTDAEFLETANPTKQPLERKQLESALDQVENGGSKASTVGEGDLAAAV